MPRPVKEDPRDCFKTFRFTEAEITRLEGRARAAGRTLSAYVRMTLLDRPEDRAGPASTAGARRFDRRERMLAEQMRKVGVNLNQIAHRMNEQRIPPPRELTMLLDEIRHYVRQAREP
jgi:DNA-binding transcriptional MerR regulator